MTLVKLLCGVVGVPGRAFSVEVDEIDFVDELKEAINETQKFPFPASRLKLFRAKKLDGKWMTEKDVEDGVGVSAQMKKLEEQSRLRTVGLSAANVRPEATDDQTREGFREVHVLVRLPTPLRISCSIVGVPDDVFSVKVEENDAVYGLKRAIKAGKRNDLKNVDAYQLRLFLAKNDDGKWRMMKDLKNGVRVTEHMKELDAEAYLSDVGLTAENVVNDTNQDVGLRDVHVLVRPPTVVIVCGAVGMPESHFTMEIDESKSVGQLKQAIRDEHKYPFPGSALRLFLAKKDDGNWITQNDVESGASDADTENLEQLDTVESPISSVGLSVEDVGPRAGSGHVNVLIGFPTSSSIRVLDSTESPLYNGVAERLKDSDEVKQLVVIIKRMHKNSEGCDALAMPFVVLENSSGAGKTQMAFNLQATGECDVFHLLCIGLGDVHQAVYGSFIKRSGVFRNCIGKDASTLGTKDGSVADFVTSPRLFIYSFIIAALHGLNVVSGLEATREDVERALDHRRKKTDKPFVFFLDEFLRVSNCQDEEKEAKMKQARMMLNALRSFNLVVVASATNGTARHLLSSSSSGNSCLVVPSLPAFASNSNVDPAFLWILQHSRPLFALRAQFYMERNPFASSGKSRFGYLTDMARELAQQFRCFKRRPDFELGQFCMLLGSKFKEIDGHVTLVDGHFARLEDKEPFKLFLDGAGGFSKVGLEDTELPKSSEKWGFSCGFPGPEEDMLLHLTLVSDHQLSVWRRDVGKSLRPLRFPVCKQWRQFTVPCDFYESKLKPSDGIPLDALVTAAVVLASHCMGFDGVKFPQFLGRLLYELGVEDDVDCVTKLPNQLRQNTVVPFVSIPNAKWPREFLDFWRASSARFANMIRATSDGDQVDFIVPSGGDMTEVSSGCRRSTDHELSDLDEEILLSGECNDRGVLDFDTLKQILQRVPTKTTTHLVAAPELQHSYFTSDVSMASVSASEYLEQIGLQHADFYRISRNGGVQEFQELMGAKATGVGTKETGAGKLILFIEVGAITVEKKRGLEEDEEVEESTKRRQYFR